jgi:hypothetical protein
VKRLGPVAAPVGPGQWGAALGLGVLVLAGCSMFRREPLDVPPGHQVVLGEVAIAGFSERHVVLDIVREDGSYRTELPVSAPRTEFVITLPRGRYQVTRLRINESGQSFLSEAWFRIGATFEVGDAAVYVGTLTIERIVFAHQARIAVQDEYERRVPTLRRRYPELPSVIARAPMRAS